MQTSRYARFIRLVYFSCDILSLNIAYLISYILRYHTFERLFSQESLIVYLFANIIWLLLAIVEKSIYPVKNVGFIEKAVVNITKVVVIHAFLIMLIIVGYKFEFISRLRLFYFYLVFWGLVVFSRLFILNLLKQYRRLGYNFKRIAIIGAGVVGNDLYEYFTSDLSYGFKVDGFFDDEPDKCLHSDKILGKINDVKNYILNNDIKELYCALPDLDTEKIRDLIEFCDRNFVRMRIVPDFRRYTVNRQVAVEFFGEIPVISLREEPLQVQFNLTIKRLFDIIFSLIIILLVFPWLVPIVGLLIKLSSPGPVFFKQLRSGEQNNQFWCFKFRTMIVNENSDIEQATINDGRITKIGHFLRKTNLDEFPQFINILKGNMSIVGPRPHMLIHTEQYSALIKQYLVRHYAKPGLTGWAQINGFRGETRQLNKMKKRVQYDIWYIENWTFLLDIRIVIVTVWKMFSGDENAA